MPLVDNWYDTVAMLDRQPEGQSNIRESMVKMIKEEPLPATRKPSNLINAFIDYYNGLLFYKAWLVEYQRTIGRLTGNAI